MRKKLPVILIFLIAVLSTARVKALDINKVLGASAYGGISLDADFDKRSGCDNYGKMVSSGVPKLYRLGVSCLKEKNISSELREEAGVDLWFLPVRKIEDTGIPAVKITQYMDRTFIFCGIWAF